MDVYQPERRSTKGRARERATARQQRQMAVRRTPEAGYVGDEHSSEPTLPPERPIMSRAPREAGSFDLEVLKGRALVAARDGAWYLRKNRMVSVVVVLTPIVLFALYLAVHILGGRVFPNVWALGQNIGGMTTTEAATLLQREWSSSTRITLRDLERTWSVTPAEIGLVLDANTTVETARSVGLSGVPLGYGVTPSVSLEFLTAQNYLLDLTEDTKVQPYNASFRWVNDVLVGVEGSDGRYIDIAATMAGLEANAPLTAQTGVFDLTMTTIPPEVRDPESFIPAAQRFASQQFLIKGYDPFNDESLVWSTDRDTLTSWLEVDETGLGLRSDVFANFVAAQTRSLQATDIHRYIEPNDTIEKMEVAIDNNSADVTLRVRYSSWQYAVQSGDTGYGIARRTGMPFYQLELGNPGRDWEVPLVVDEFINIPSPDLLLPTDPLPTKRIVVNLRTQYLVAFENGEKIFEWSIASGMDRAPTSPGIFQILNHYETAEGGSYELCSALGCAQWEMTWFMGIYEVFPGLVNGFHGNVILANGRLLGDGNVGFPATYGCVMSEQEEAEALYDWAEVGTVVEIISGDYEPRSQLAEQVWNNGARTWEPMPQVAALG